MKLPRLILWLGLLAAPGFAFGQSAKVVPDFKGLRLGSTLGEVARTLWARESDRNLRQARGIEVTNSVVIISTLAIRKSIFSNTIVGEPATISLKFERDLDEINQSRLYDIQVLFNKQLTPTVRDGIREKYGFKGQSDGISDTWIFDDGPYVIVLQNSPTSKEAMLQLTDPAALQRMRAKFDSEKAEDTVRRKKDL
jgi:hypothetical protein